MAGRQDDPGRHYQAYGAALELWERSDEELILSGPAGTGKSRACLEKVHACCLRWPGCRWLIARKTRTSLSESGLVTLETKVFPENSPIAEGAGRSHRQVYTYPNGSEIVVGGLDKPSKIMSTEYDGCFIGDTEVSSPSPIERGFDRPYSGQLVTITTAAGNNLTGTPNHPVLTPNGWVGLGSLHEGDYVIGRHLGKPLTSQPDPDVAYQPAPIAKVVRALAKSGGGRGRTQRIETVPVHFHGDGTHGYVDVVTAGRLFQDCQHPEFPYPVAELDGGRAELEQAVLMGYGASIERLIALGSALSPATAEPELAHSLSIGFGPSPDFRSTLPRLGEISLPVEIDAHPGLPGGERVGGSLPADASLDHLLLEARHADVNGCGYLHKPPLPGEIAADRVVDVSITDVGNVHVYNLQTEASWYYASDIIVHNCYVQETIELTENDWEAITTRLRNGVMPFQQIIADTNPDTPSHWIKLRANRGDLTMLESRHEDNPTLWDRDRGEWTPSGSVYLGKLDRLTGARKERLRHGRWVQAEGVVYEAFDRAVHVVKRFPIPASWRRIRSIDFGYTNPFVCLWFAIDHDGRMVLYREIYMSGRTIAVHARRIRELSAGEKYEATVADHDASERASLLEAGIHTVPAQKAIRTGIQAVCQRLDIQGDGRPRLTIFADALAERDPVLDEAKLPCSTVEEFDCYVWPKGQDGKAVKEVPVDLHNHGMDAMRYAVMQGNRIRLPMFIKLN